MTDLPSLLYTSTSEIPTLSQTWSLKKVPLPGRSLPVQAIIGSTPNPPPPPGFCSLLPPLLGKQGLDTMVKVWLTSKKNPKPRNVFDNAGREQSGKAVKVWKQLLHFLNTLGKVLSNRPQLLKHLLLLLFLQLEDLAKKALNLSETIGRYFLRRLLPGRKPMEFRSKHLSMQLAKLLVGGEDNKTRDMSINGGSFQLPDLPFLSDSTHTYLDRSVSKPAVRSRRCCYCCCSFHCFNWNFEFFGIN